MKSRFRNRLAFKVFLSFFVFLLLAGEVYGEDNVTVNFIDEDIKVILAALAKQKDLNIVVSDKVEGKISIRLKDVPFWDALQAVLETKGLGYQMIAERIIKVTTLKELEELQKMKGEIVPEMDIEIFSLRYANAEEVQKIIEKLLSKYGSVTIYRSTVRGGWPVGGIATGETGAGGTLGQTQGVIERRQNKPQELPQILIIRDLSENIARIRELIETLDRPPRQILVEAMIVEVTYDAERDMGIDWESMGQEGAVGEDAFAVGEGREVSAGIEGGSPTLEGFTGLTLTYRRLLGAAYQAKIRALEQEGKANVLSKPKMLVLEGHEATILVGKKYPIISWDVITSQGDAFQTGELDHYEPIGVMLKVVPVIWDNNRINMVIHPSVTSLGQDIIVSQSEEDDFTSTTPEIITTEVDTNITINTGDTVVIGGLIKNEERITEYRVPIIGQIPILGRLFKRENKTKNKAELLIFLTPRITHKGIVTEDERERLKEYEEFLRKKKK